MASSGRQETIPSASSVGLWYTRSFNMPYSDIVVTRITDEEEEEEDDDDDDDEEGGALYFSLLSFPPFSPPAVQQ
jgi:hypothetical protein